MGTDSHRVASYNPWVALRWMLDGKTVDGKALRGPEETPHAADIYARGAHGLRSPSASGGRSRSASRRPRRVIEGLLHRAGGRDRGDRGGDDGGGREGGV